MTKDTKSYSKNIGIIGGGIAGLYAARELLRKGHHVTIFEKNEMSGGRICTATSADGLTYEGGAGRFHKGHRRLMKLLKEYHLLENMVPNNKRRIFIKDGKSNRFDLEKAIAYLLDQGAIKTKTYLQQRTLLAFMYEVMPASMVEDMMHAFGYVSEFDTCNAYDSLRVFCEEFRDTINYFSLKGGLSSILRELHKDIKDATIMYNKQIDKLEYDGTVTNVYCGKQKWTFDHCLVCVTRNALKKIDGMEKNPHVQNVIAASLSRPLHRIYARFPVSANGECWFKTLPRVTTNNMIGYIIPIHPESGLIMISYTDGQMARMWNHIKKNGALEETLMTHVKNTFPQKTIPNPLWIDSWYWEEGAHYWQLQRKNKYMKYSPSKNELQQFGYVLGGEVVSPYHQAWIEGALESIDRALPILIH